MEHDLPFAVEGEDSSPEGDLERIELGDRLQPRIWGGPILKRDEQLRDFGVGHESENTLRG